MQCLKNTQSEQLFESIITMQDKSMHMISFIQKY